ncbi:MAG: hypothetical protein AMJ53_03960 [Gammaproteobacteria bacterium SG8_11]|nr:MAG: hypothetical protein AMJ53_03960 [Gammaproteobacteria bacterium SG8_11]
MKQTKAVLSIFLGGLLTIASIPANAILVLELSTDNATLQVRDNELYKDFSAKEGKISHLIEDFDGWDINTTGLSNPYIGTHAEAELDLAQYLSRVSWITQIRNLEKISSWPIAVNSAVYHLVRPKAVWSKLMDSSPLRQLPLSPTLTRVRSLVSITPSKYLSPLLLQYWDLVY